MDQFREKELWTSYLVTNKINQMVLLSILSYQFYIFLYLHQNFTVTIQVCNNILGYDNHSLSVLMSSQVGIPWSGGLSS